MSFRGRGGFGGRGRGRFGGGGGYVPQARGDDGQPVFAQKTDGPPPLFPTITTLPDLPDVGKTEEELISRRRRLETFWNASPYYIEKPKEKTTGVAAEIERYSDKYKTNFNAKRPPLASVLKLTSAYFPAELVGQQDRKRGRDGQYKGTSQWTLDTSSRKSDLQRLDRLATMEQKSEKIAEDKEGKEEEKKTDGGDDEDDEELEKEEEEEIGEDDYAQNFGFDDDDDYLDDDDGGDDEGPTF